MLNKGCFVVSISLYQTTCTLKEAKPWIDGTIARPCFVVVLSLVIPSYTVSSTFDHAWPQGSGFLMVIPRGIQHNTLFWQSKKCCAEIWMKNGTYVLFSTYVQGFMVHIQTIANHCMEYPIPTTISPYESGICVAIHIVSAIKWIYSHAILCAVCSIATCKHGTMVYIPQIQMYITCIKCIY